MLRGFVGGMGDRRGLGGDGEGMKDRLVSDTGNWSVTCYV